jgi:hypothetical protein
MPGEPLSVFCPREQSEAGEVPTEALAEVGEGGMHRPCPLRFARKCSLSTSPAARRGVGERFTVTREHARPNLHEAATFWLSRLSK